MGYAPRVPTIARFNVTPVRSTSLLHPDEIVLGPLGVDEDRRFLFLDRDGRRISGAAKAALLAIRSCYDASEDLLYLQLPDGTDLQERAAPIGERMQVAMLDREVEVRRVPGAIDGAVSRYLDSEVALVRVEPPERGGGSHPVSLVSLGSVDELGRRAGRRDRPDPRRFRMLIELEGCSPHEEDGWSGRRVRLGDAVVRVGEGIPRCVVTTMHPDTGETDFPTLDVLATYRQHDGQLLFGVYADVEEPGKVHVGDRVAVLEGRADR